MYVTALSLSSEEVKKMSSEGRGDAWKLWRGWAEMEWEQKDEKRVLQVISAAAGPVGLLGEWNLVSQLSLRSETDKALLLSQTDSSSLPTQPRR